MTPTNLMTRCDRYQRVRQTNATDNGFPTRVPRTTRPSGVGDNAAQATASAVIDRSQLLDDFLGQNVLRLAFFGAGSNNNTFSARVIAWDNVDEQASQNDEADIWVPTVLCELAVTLSSTPVGLAGTVLNASQLFADTIALTGTTANDDVSIDIVSPANDTIAHVCLDMKGAQLIEVTFTTGGSATSCNALWKMY